jgi:anti-anti-sigma regulatory factor
LARATAFDATGLVLDMSKVGSIGASTLGVVVRAREFLRQRSRSLTVRAPSASARRSIDEQGVNDLLGPNPEMTGNQSEPALRCWVEVPRAEQL